MKILFLSTIISLAFSTAAPAGGYLGCNSVAETPCELEVHAFQLPEFVHVLQEIMDLNVHKQQF